jgi:NHLM bacteriocin system ABC transporter ATP-binding protein
MTHGARLIAGNQTIRLDAEHPPSLLTSGSAVVFAVDRDNGERTHLFSLDAGDPVLALGGDGESGWHVMAVPLEPGTLQPLGGLRDGAGAFALENWLGKIAGAVASLRPGETGQIVKAGESPILGHGKRIGVEEGLVFVRLDAGDGKLAGLPVHAGAMVALVPGLWLEADTPGSDPEWKILESAGNSAAWVLTFTLDLAMRILFRALDEVKRYREEADRQRFSNRQELNAQVTHDALKHLTAVSGGSPAAFRTMLSGDPLLEAVRAVAAHLGIAARPASDGAGERLRGIANASGFRIRIVALSGEWWRADNGPLIAFRRDGSPVALLPEKSGMSGKPRYQIVDAAAGTRVRASAETSADLTRRGCMIYRPLPDDLSTRSLLRHALASRREDLRTIALAGIGAAALALAAPQGAAILIGQAIPDADTGMIWQVTLGMIAASFGSALFLLTQAVATLRAQTSAFNALQSGVWDYLLKLGPAFFRGFTAGQLRMRADAMTRIHQMLTADALRSLFAGAASLLTLVLVLWYSPGLFLIAVGSGAVIAATGWFGCRALNRLQGQWQETDELLSGLLLQAINAVSKLRVAGAANRAFHYWAREYSRKQKLALSIQTIRDRIQIVNMVMPPASLALGFFYLLGRPLPLSSFLACVVAMSAFLAALTASSNTIASLALTDSLWQRMRTILAGTPEVDSAKTHPGRLRGRIAVENLTFRYRNDGPLILDSVSIRAEPGECIALTGPSGSGKSTLLNLMLRFETPASGAIYLDGRELSSLDIGAVRRQIGVVTQDGRLMAGSIFENICCGGNNTLDEAWDAARAAGLAADIEEMSMGMHTIVAEGGTNFSGGQRQRLLIARALVLKPALLFFDEATSALDNRTQAIVTDSLRQMRATRILIAHRLSTIRNADRIYVLDKGRIVQQGTYGELASQPGLFARLVSRQKV